MNLLRALLLLCWSSCFFSVALRAQPKPGTGELKGMVLDSASREPVIGAVIFLEQEKSRGTSANINGQYSLRLPAGRQRLICTMVGMRPDTFTVFIDSGAVNNYTILLHELVNTYNVVVVSAGKYEQKLEDITVSMEVLKPALIESRNNISIDKALEQVPGLTILDNEPQIRGGSGFGFGVGSRVSTLIDGIPVMQGDVGRTEWQFIPIENAEQVEVIKGASSVLYGSSALSGVINIRTAYPREKPQTKVAVYSGVYSPPQNDSAKWWTGNAMQYGLTALHSRQIGRCDVVATVAGIYDHNYIGPPVKIAFFPTTDTINEQDVENRAARFSYQFRWRPKKNDRLNLGMNGSFMQAHNNFTLVWGNDSSGIYRAYPGTMTIQDQVIYFIDPFINYYTRGGFRHALRSRFFSTVNENSNNQSNSSRIYYAEYQFAKTLNVIENLNLTGGVVMNLTHSNATLFMAGGSPDNRLQNWSGYTQLDKKFWKVLNFSLGFRGEYFTINGSESVLRPIVRSGLNLKLGQATFLRYSYGQGYRYPTIAEKFIFTNAGGITIFPNPGIQPETSWNTEAGLKQGFKIGKFMGFADAAVFWQEYTNTIEYIYAVWKPDTVGFKFVNTGDTRVRGVEFSVMGEGFLYKKWKATLLGGYTYTLPQAMNPQLVFAQDNPAVGITPNQLSYSTTSTDTTDYILKYRFQHLAKCDLEISRTWLAFGASWRYYSHMQNIDKAFYILDAPNLPGSGISKYREKHSTGIHVMDARIAATIKGKYKAAFIVNNLLNLEYSLRPLKIESPRTFQVRFSVSI